MTPLILVAFLLAQAPQPYQPYVQPAPYRAPMYTPRQPYVVPALPPGSPSLMIPPGDITPLPPLQPAWRAR